MDFICPYKCSYRTNSGYCGSTGGWERCQFRQIHQPNTVVGYVPPLKKTNADRIRSMTDEELAELWWERVDCGECPVHRDCKMTGQDCKKLALNWLREERSDGL